MTRVTSGLLVLMLIGCKGGSPEQPAAEPAAAEPAVVAEPGPATEPAPAAEPAPAGQVACHLNCSGQERTAYGASEEQARAAAQQLVKATCRPEDGQFFIVCDPAPTE